MSVRTALYRHWDADGNLLYVGISLSAVARLSRHISGSPWADKIVNVTVEYLPSRDEALVAEKAAIMEEKPIWNKVHNRGALLGANDNASRIDQLIPHDPDRLERALTVGRFLLNQWEADEEHMTPADKERLYTLAPELEFYSKVSVRVAI